MEDRLNELPKGWVWAKLGDIGIVASGGTPSTKDEDNFKGNIAWVTPADLSNFIGKFISKGSRNLSEKGLKSSSAVLLPAGSILFSSRAPIGYVVIASNPISTNQGFKNLILPRDIFNEYVFYYLKGSKRLVESLASGTTFLEISGSKFTRVPIPLPPLPEQHRIVAKIEELFTRLDAGIEALKKIKAQLKRYRQVVLKYAFEGKLTNENMAEGQMPDRWRLFPIGKVVKTIDGDRGSNYPKKNEFSKKGYCLFLSTKNVREDRFVFEENIFISKEKDEILRGGKLQLNDVVITTRGTLGNVALYDDRVPFKNVRINSGMLILRVIYPMLNNYYLMKFVSSPLFIKQLKEKQSGTAQPQIPANVLREIQLPIPPTLEEQEKIVAEIKLRLSVSDKIEESIEKSLKQSEALRQSIFKQAFEGKLVPQDPTDEPAVKLLGRIKEEKIKREGENRSEKKNRNKKSRQMELI